MNGSKINVFTSNIMVLHHKKFQTIKKKKNKTKKKKKKKTNQTNTQTKNKIIIYKQYQ